MVFAPVNEIRAGNADHALNVQKGSITKIASLSQIPDPLSLQTIYFFDIDDTLFDTPCMLGSKAWRKYIIEATKNDVTCNWHDFFFSLFGT